ALIVPASRGVSSHNVAFLAASGRKSQRSAITALDGAFPNRWLGTLPPGRHGRIRSPVDFSHLTVGFCALGAVVAGVYHIMVAVIPIASDAACTALLSQNVLSREGYSVHTAHPAPADVRHVY